MENKPSTKEVETQERTFIIYKDYICCANCAKNLNMEQRHRGRIVKNYCNVYNGDSYVGEPLPQYTNPIDPNDVNYSIEEDRKKAQSCPYFLPEGMNIAADLTYLAPAPINDLMVTLEETHANRLDELFNKGFISK